jgi:HTH-type transcriptional regulator/antitoxin HipB
MDIRSANDAAAVLRSRRLALGLTQRQVAERLGVSRQWVVGAEAGAPTAHFDLMLRALAAVNLRVNAYEDQSAALFAEIQEGLK